METSHKILILDDDADWLDVCREMLAQLPSKPEVLTVGVGARAIAMLDARPFRLLICDLRLPRMDGLQVLAIVRRRFPGLRTVVVTGLDDEEFRSRAYALGVDLFWLKSDMHLHAKMFMDCIESLLGSEAEVGFRGVQNKSLMDIIQMEGLSNSSTVLRITRGRLVAKIWIQNGGLIDAEVEGERGEVAFQRILTWKSGAFESLPAEPNRERTIFKSVNALLLESAQAIDESTDPPETQFIARSGDGKTVRRLSLLAGDGAEFVVTVPPEGQGKAEVWGAHLGEQLAGWTRRAAETATHLGERLDAGPLAHIAGSSVERRIFLLSGDNKIFLVGWPPGKAGSQSLEKSKKLAASWDS